MKHKMQKQILKLIFFLILFLILPNFTYAAPVPVLNFSDIDSGPKTGNTDGVGLGAIVTIWGNYLGSSQGTSKVYVGDQEATAIYYWKNADGQLPSGPADLYSSHKMQEIAFAIPATAPDGLTTIKVVVNGIETNTLPFTVRTGNIYFVKTGGSDSTGNGSWGNAWGTLQNVVDKANAKIVLGDIVYIAGVDALNTSIEIRGPFTGTIDNPFSLIVYPNTRVNISGGSNGQHYSLFYGMNGVNSYWNYSKFSLTSLHRAFNLQQGMRIIGNWGTSPNNDGTGMDGWVSGSCPTCNTPTLAAPMGGAKIYGNEITHFGKADGTTDVSTHLFYISNRSGQLVDAFEIAWGNFHENPVNQGLHVYDMVLCGGWNGPIKLHHNFIKNQGGNAINLNPNCANANQFEVFDNVIISDAAYSEIGFNRAGNPFRFDTSPSQFSTAKVYNNTVYGIGTGVANIVTQGFDFKNNIIIDNDNTVYGTVTTNPFAISNNLFFSIPNSSLAIPLWASGSLNSNPLFTDATSYDFSLQVTSPVKAAGSDAAISVAPTDFYGQPRVAGSVSMGAIQYVSAAIDVTGPAAPIGLGVQ
jgi:hypothetical protein